MEIRTPPKRGPGRPPGTGKHRAIAPPRPQNQRIPPPKINVPDFSEWHDYLGNFVIKWITRGYIAFVFRGIDRWELLSAAENQALELDDKELSDIAKPIAHLANGSKFGKKYGRLLIDSSDGIAAFIQLSMWANRVNRIARRYRPGKERNERVVPGEVINEGEPGEFVQGPSFTPQPGYSGNGTPGHGYN